MVMNLSAFLPKQVTLNQAKDVGLALTFLFLLVFLISRNDAFLFAGMILLLATALYPRAFTVIGRYWFGLALLLSEISAFVIFSVLFYGLITPIGMVQRLFGRDPLFLRKWKKSRDSVFVAKTKPFGNDDLINPF